MLNFIHNRKQIEKLYNQKNGLSKTLQPLNTEIHNYADGKLRSLVFIIIYAEKKALIILDIIKVMQ